MAYAECGFYLSEDFEPIDTKRIIPADEFALWEGRASEELDTLTFGRLADYAIDTPIRKCVCRIAELLYTDSLRGGIVSENTDGYSVTYEKEKPQAVRISDIAKKYISGTGLLYRGW